MSQREPGTIVNYADSNRRSFVHETIYSHYGVLRWHATATTSCYGCLLRLLRHDIITCYDLYAVLTVLNRTRYSLHIALLLGEVKEERVNVHNPSYYLYTPSQKEDHRRVGSLTAVWWEQEDHEAGVGG
ncbi:hypothetical protein LSAT2_001471 [Lamellibrachia satsuma]|nr:hypothetical protein LSAT2_001471 [Lamellibrachia satsuma]